jgi:exosortase A-associated hydrolase 1/exosortase A-associated hydrolase 2
MTRSVETVARAAPMVPATEPVSDGAVWVERAESRKVSIRAFLIAGSRGPLNALYYEPTAKAVLGDILFIPSFGEELNRCRSMVSMQARLLADLGIGTLILDPHGTGDSGGKHADATWATWRDDLRLGIEWLRREANGCSTLWGVRLGAIMASDLACTDPGIERLLLWQPVLQGKVFYNQFLRIRVAAEMDQPNGIKTTDELRRRAREGETLEVSGYHINPTLSQELDDIKFAEAQQLRRCKLHWFEVVASEEAPVAQVNRKAIETYQSSGVDVQFERIVGPLFWHVHERVVTPQLLRATTEQFEAAARAVPVRHASAVPSQSRANATSTNAAEHPILFPCGDAQMVGVLHRTAQPAKRGVVVVVAGGPQYRAGAHRQFVSLARELVEIGMPVLRFDLRGMGDSNGRHRGFQHSNDDIRAAIDALLAHEPQLQEIVLFGECESASGILFYAFQDARVKGAVLVNPWVRTEEGRAKVIVKHYYSQRIFEREFWRKIVTGKFQLRASLKEFLGTLRTVLTRSKQNMEGGVARTYADIADMSLPLKTAVGLKSFGGAVMILMSGKDYIAREFDEVVSESTLWQTLMARPSVQRIDLADADHTFSRDEWRLQASESVRNWMRSW